MSGRQIPSSKTSDSGRLRVKKLDGAPSLLSMNLVVEHSSGPATVIDQACVQLWNDRDILFFLTLSVLSSKVKVTGQSLRSRERKILLKWSVRPRVRAFQLT